MSQIRFTFCREEAEPESSVSTLSWNIDTRCAERDRKTHTSDIVAIAFLITGNCDEVAYCCNLSGGVALIVWFTTNGMCVKNNTIICVTRASNSKKDCDVKALPRLACERLNVMTSVRKKRLRAWSLLLLAATERSFAHLPLGISDRSTTNDQVKNIVAAMSVHGQRVQFFYSSLDTKIFSAHVTCAIITLATRMFQIKPKLR